MTRSAPAGESSRAADSARVAAARALVLDYAARTGLLDERAPARRYLWTDAFAVCNLLELYRRSGEAQLLELARRLVAQVHDVLGRHRPDDPRRGWISGLPEAEGRAHPTRGGLRIGKPLPERGASEAYDAELEWERDGQYFHYLTRWMHALSRVAGVTGDARPLVQAIELARAACRGFAGVGADGRPRLCWKMSVDLARPLVPSTGQHDALDGLLTCLELATRAASFPSIGGGGLEPEIAALRTMAAGRAQVTDDPLGIGGLLGDAYRLAQMIAAGSVADDGLLAHLLGVAQEGLSRATRRDFARAPAEYRLAFRELGLAIGLEAVPRMAALLEARAVVVPGLAQRLAALRLHVPLAEELVAFWSLDESRASRSWRAHEDIDAVMLATALVPDGYLSL